MKVAGFVIFPTFIMVLFEGSKVTFWTNCAFPLTLAANMAVLYKNHGLSVLVFSTRKRHSTFWKKFLCRRRSVSKLKYWKRSKGPSIMSLKHTDFSNRKLFWKSLVLFFSRTYVLSIAFKMKPLKKHFLVLMQKPAQILP